MQETQSNKRYYWMRFQQDFFGSLRIKKLRRLAGGDTFTIIYLKLQLLSISNEGYLEYKHVFESFEEEMAEEIKEDVDNINVTVSYLLSCGLMIQEGDTYFLPYAAENIGSETASAQRVRDYRNRKKESAMLHCNNSVTDVKQLCSVEREKEREKDKEIERDREIEASPRASVDYAKIVNLYNQICTSFPKVTTLSESRKKAIKARLTKYSEADFVKVFEKAEASDFLKGNNNRNWSANFDWLINDTNMAKVLDGNYDNREGGQVKAKHGYDWENL